jgi:hypothetical protein
MEPISFHIQQDIMVQKVAYPKIKITTFKMNQNSVTAWIFIGKKFLYFTERGFDSFSNYRDDLLNLWFMMRRSKYPPYEKVALICPHRGLQKSSRGCCSSLGFSFSS